MKKKYFAALFLFSVQSFLFAQIPASRIIDWSKAGVQGGIITFSKAKNFNNNGGIPNDPNVDNSIKLQALINTVAGTGTVINIPTGTYRFKNKVSIPAGGNVIIRGAGADKTILEFETGAINEGNFTIWGSQDLGPLAVTGNCTFNSKKLTLSSVAGLTVGDWINISQENDVSVMSTNNPADALTQAPRAVGQVMKITAISGKILTLDRPLHYTYNTSLTVQVNRFKMTEKVGFENFTIKSLISGDKSHFLMNYTANCWIKCVRSIKSVSTHVNPSFSANLTIRDSYFNDAFDFGGGGHGYGIAVSMHTTDCLIENNIFDKLRHAMLVQRGANGNVFGYNYSINATSDGSISIFNRIPDGSLHGHWPYMNLYEGNVLQEIHSADNWGPSGQGNTFFRNRVTREGIRISDRSIDQNIVGNDLRKDATANFTQDVIIDEAGCISTLIHGNKENGTVSWDQSLGSNNLISSYYLSSVPSFFGGNAWPCLGPEYPAGIIPAEDRFTKNFFTQCEDLTTSLNEEQAAGKKTSVYPNPSAGNSFNISCADESGIDQVEIIDMNGQLIYRLAANGENNLVVQTELSAGIYIVRVLTDKTVYIEKLLKQ